MNIFLVMIYFQYFIKSENELQNRKHFRFCDTAKYFGISLNQISSWIIQTIYCEAPEKYISNDYWVWSEERQILCCVCCFSKYLTQLQPPLHWWWRSWNMVWESMRSMRWYFQNKSRTRATLHSQFFSYLSQYSRMGNVSW